MSGKYEDWAPLPLESPLRLEDCKLPELYLMSIDFKRGFERRPYRDVGEAEERTEFVPKPYDDKLTVRLRRGDNNYEAKFTFNGLDAGHFMDLIKPLVTKYREATDEERELAQQALQRARSTNLETFADQVRKELGKTFPGCILVSRGPNVVEVKVPSSKMMFYLHF